MSPILIAAIGGVALAALLHKSIPTKLEVGKRYRATFQAPTTVTSDLLVHLRDIMPPGSVIGASPETGRISVEFVSVSSAPVTDVSTPVGVFKLLSVEAL